MSPDELSKSMSDRGEGIVSMMFRMMGHGIAQQTKLEAQGKAPQLDLLGALFDRDRAGSMKRMFAEQFESLDDMMQALDGPERSAIITERNKVASPSSANSLLAEKRRSRFSTERDILAIWRSTWSPTFSSGALARSGSRPGNSTRVPRNPATRIENSHPCARPLA